MCFALMLLLKHSQCAIPLSLRELFELRSQLQELKSTVEIRLFSPAALEDASPAILRKNPLRIATLVNLNGTDLFLTSKQGRLGGDGSISCSIPSDEKESIEDSDEDATSSEVRGTPIKQTAVKLDTRN